MSLYRNALLFVILPALSVVQAQEQELLHGVYKQHYDDGALKGEYRYQHGKLDGEQKTYYPDGQLQRRAMRQQGLASGLDEFFHENGQLASRTHFGPDGIEGEVKTFYDNGSLATHAVYLNGKLHGRKRDLTKEGWLNVQQDYWHGLLHGEQRIYSAKDRLSAVTQYRHGKKVGLEQRFAEDRGHLQLQRRFDEQSRLLLEILFAETGVKLRETSFRYYAAGEYKDEQRFDAGKLVLRQQNDSRNNWQLLEKYNAAAVLTERKELQDGVYQGSYITTNWHGDREQAEFIAGKKHGLYRYSYAKSVYYTEGHYANDLKVGNWTEHSAAGSRNAQYNTAGNLHGRQQLLALDGSLLSVEHYDNGRLHGEAEERSAQGLLLAKGSYVEGLRKGFWQLQDYQQQHSVKLWQGEFNAGKEVGKWQAFSANGTLLTQLNFDSNGRRQGMAYTYAEDGSLYMTEQFLNDELHGELILYRNGEPDEIQYYLRGARVLH